MKFLTTIDEAAVSLILSAWEEVRNWCSREYDISSRNHEIFWMNFGTAGAPRIDTPAARSLLQWAEMFLEENRDLVDGDAVIDECSFVINPVGSRHQKWHLDYDLLYSEIFISLSPVTENNATQFLSFEKGLNDNLKNFVLDNRDDINFESLIEFEGSITISQFLCRQYVAYYMKGGVIHRGISNVGTFDRMLLNISLRHSNNFRKCEANVSNENTHSYLIYR